MSALPVQATTPINASERYYKHSDGTLSRLSVTDCGENYKTVAGTTQAATVISTVQGRLAQIWVTTTGTGTSPVFFYDSATATGSSPILSISGASSAGTSYTPYIPVANGITVGQVTNGPALNVIYN